MTMHTDWHGDEITVRARRANGRAIIGMAEQVAVDMKKAAHVGESGDLRRSIHAAKVNTLGEVNVTEPGGESAPVSPGAAAAVKKSKVKLGVEVGSWLPYACVENNRGGSHRFADIGWQLGKATFDTKLKKAWKDEGL